MYIYNILSRLKQKFFPPLLSFHFKHKPVTESYLRPWLFSDSKILESSYILISISYRINSINTISEGKCILFGNMFTDELMCKPLCTTWTSENQD